jgi:23S rRNA pseudouridine955/2504/2580 synthase/23S rRNA pseudouridine1911/1915/1917 synthase
MHKLPFDIVFENEQLIAVSKPSGMLTLPDRHDGELQSLRGLLQQKFGQIFVVHRLDKDTGGLIVFAKNEATHKYMSALFEGRDIQKQYAGFVFGKPDPAEGSIRESIAEHPAKNGSMIIHHKGKPSHTDYKVVESFSTCSLVEFTIHTGRTHQIRVHSKFIGHPIVCDPIYGDGKPVLVSSFKKKYKLSKNEETERPILSRLALHAHRLSFIAPAGEPLTLEAPLPKDFRALLQQLRNA